MAAKQAEQEPAGFLKGLGLAAGDFAQRKNVHNREHCGGVPVSKNIEREE
jgi:hypothetical protein